MGNRFFGFDEEKCSAVGLYCDRAGRKLRPIVRDNVFERCAQAMNTDDALWSAAHVEGNLEVDE